MNIKETLNYLKENNMPKYSLGAISSMGFGYLYDFKLRVCETTSVDYGPWVTKLYEKSEEEFIKDWCNRVYNYLINNPNFDKVNISKFKELKEKLN